MVITTRLESLLSDANRRVVQHARRFRYIYALVAVVIFFGGVGVSVWALDLRWEQLETQWLLLNMLAGAPIVIALNAIALKISAAIVGASLSFGVAFKTCCIAICSNLLPIPAGSVIQVSSLASHGGAVIQSGIVITIGNVISLSLVMVLVGSLLAVGDRLLGSFILVAGFLGLVASTAFVLTKATPRLVVAFLAVRVLRTLVMVIRIQLSFLVIGLVVSTLDAALFSGAVLIGTLVSVFPGGLGVSEIVAALLAMATTIAPEAAFFAVAVNRISTLVFAGIIVGLALQFDIGKKDGS